MLDFVVARALKRDPAVRYQDARELGADLSTCVAELRSQEKSADSGSRTVRLEPSGGKAEEAPAARAIAVDTRLPLSHLFDNAPALKRIASSKDLARMPSSVGILRRACLDAAVRRLFLLTLFAGAAGAYVAFV
jgi:hypothetical protein